MSTYEVMMLLKEGERVSDRRSVETRLYDMLHTDVASGKVRMIDVDDPLYAAYLDGGWDACITFSEYVERIREKEAAKREFAEQA